MFNSELSIEVSNCLNPKVMRVFDMSIYYADEKVENHLLEVLPVNKDKWITFYTKKDFSLILNSSNLQYKKAIDNYDLIDLPDGIYEFKLSYKPNIKTLSYFYHLRIVDAMRKIYYYKDKLLGKVCNLSHAEYIINRDKLRDIEEYLMAAKWKVEECNEKKHGIELYQWALKLLERYANECQCK